MAVVASLLTSAGSTTDAASYNTASVSPTNGSLILLCVARRENAPNSISGCGLTWTEVDSAVTTDGVQGAIVYKGVGTPSAGAITIGFAGTQSNCGWMVVEFSEAEVTNSADGIVEGTNSGLTVTLPTFANSENATFGFVRFQANKTIANGSGFTQLGEVNTAEFSMDSQFKNTNDTSVDWTWASDGNRAAGVAVEIGYVPAVGGSFLFNLL